MNENIVGVVKRSSAEAWALVEANEGLLYEFFTRTASWALVPDKKDEAVQVGRLLVFRAAQTWDESTTTFATWVNRVLVRQFGHRFREATSSCGDPLLEDRIDVREAQTSARRYPSRMLSVAVRRLRAIPNVRALLSIRRRAMVRVVLRETLKPEEAATLRAQIRASLMRITREQIEDVKRRWKEI